MSIVDSQSLEIWVQSGIPELGELVFNVHFRNSRNIEWEVSYRLSQFGGLDIDINKRTDALRDVAFPSLGKDKIAVLTSSSKYKNKMKDLEHCRMGLEQWVYYVITRIEVLPDDLRDTIENFFYLPGGPDGIYVDDYMSSVGGGSEVASSPGIASLSSLQVNPAKLTSSPSGESFDDTVSEYTVGSVDENGVPKKKKKRIIKGAKRRLSKAFGMGQKKESFGVDAAGMENTATAKPTPSVMSGSSTALSDGRGSAYGDTTPKSKDVQSVQPGKLIKARVIRGGERSRGVPEYEIQLVYNPDKRPYTATHVFADFQELHDSIEDANGVGVGSSFPANHVKSSLGLSLTEEQQAERTRMLDAWTKDLISSYQYMNDKERMLVRSFLNLDLSVQKDIYLQDKMANGMVEAPRASIATSQAACPDDATSQFSGNSKTSNGRPSANRRDSSMGSGKVSVERRAIYKVKIASTGNLGDAKAHPMRQKLDLKDLDGSVFTDENSVDSQSNLFPSKQQKTAVGRKESTLSFIEEERGDFDETSSRRPPEGGMLEENLLKIGMKEKKKKQGCRCVVS